MKWIFHYLSNTWNLWLTYGEKFQGLVGYTDANDSMGEDRKAILGIAFLIDGGAISWSSKKQEIVSLSMTESKYVAMMHGVCYIYGLCLPLQTYLLADKWLIV